MAILKPGFTPGFRGRKQAATLTRRAHYLASEHDRESARLLGMESQALTPEQAVEAMGGPQVSYHEIIVAPSDAECRTIEGRVPEDPQRARAEAGHRLVQAYAKGRPYVFAIHEQDGRFHYHLVVRGPMDGQALGKHGQAQKLWDRELFGDEPRIQDWEAHQRFRESRTRLQQVIREQRENEVQRRDAVKRALPQQKAEVARPFEVRGRDLIERRYALEEATLLARYEARGTVGSPRHLAELEQVEHRRTGSLRRLEKRELGREMGAAKARLGQGIEMAGRGVQRGVRAGGALVRSAADEGLRAMGVPKPARVAVGMTFAMTQEALQAALRVGMELSKAATRSSVHVAQASVKITLGLASAIPTAGASLTTATQEAGRDLGSAAQELGQGATRAGAEGLKGAARTAGAGAQELVPRQVQVMGQAATTMAQTVGGATKDALSLSPVSFAQTIGGGALDLTKTALRGAGAMAPLPKPVRVAFQMAGWVPVVGVTARAIQLAAEVTHAAIPAASRGLERD